jgi:HYR domain-containing protein
MTGNNRMARGMTVAALIMALGTVAAVPVASGGEEGDEETGALALRATFAMISHMVPCPPGTDADLCATREGRADISGLGNNVSESYSYPIRQDAKGCPAGSFQILAYRVLVTVRDKGTISFAVPGSTENCLPSALNPTYPPVTIAGGSGLYAGASGTVTLEQHAAYTPDGGAAGTDKWAGTLTVAGVEFDVTPPTLRGAVGKTVRARNRLKRVRVTYRVTGRDDLDGAVPVTCRPSSGSRFKIGRTVVKCSSTDRSANTRTARFTIIVKASR